jgi:hypothetical protein
MQFPALRRVRPALIVLGCALSLCACSSAGRLESATPRGIDLTGTWKLNRALSDDPVKLLERMRGRQGPASPQSGRSGDQSDEGLPGDDRRAGRMPDDQEGGGRRHTMRRERIMPADFFADVGPGRSMLRIEQHPTELVIDNGLRARKLTPGGSSVVSMANGVADQRSGWNASDYVITTSGRDRPTIIERFSLSTDRTQLLVNVKIDGNGHMPNIDLKRVYDAASSSAPESGPST